MSNYEHELTIRFKLRSNDPVGEDLALDQVRKAVARRLAYLTLISLNGSEDWKDAVLPPICTRADWPGGGRMIEIHAPPRGERNLQDGASK